jgi:hypothetical protein
MVTTAQAPVVASWARADQLPADPRQTPGWLVATGTVRRRGPAGRAPRSWSALTLTPSLPDLLVRGRAPPGGGANGYTLSRLMRTRCRRGLVLGVRARRAGDCWCAIAVPRLMAARATDPTAAERRCALAARQRRTPASPRPAPATCSDLRFAAGRAARAVCGCRVKGRPPIRRHHASPSTRPGPDHPDPSPGRRRRQPRRYPHGLPAFAASR